MPPDGSNERHRLLQNLVVAGLQSGEHDTKFPLGEMVVHQVFDDVNLRSELENARPNHDVLEDGEEVVHRPTVVATTHLLALAVNLAKGVGDHVDFLQWSEFGLQLRRERS